MNKRAGFTLIEILIVIAILGILLSIVVPPFALMVERYRFKSTVRQVYTDLLLARSISFTLHKPCLFSQVATGYKIEDSDHNVIKEVSLSGIFFSSSPPFFSFHSSGRLDPLLPVEIELSNGSSDHYLITVSTIGHVRVVKDGG